MRCPFRHSLSASCISVGGGAATATMCLREQQASGKSPSRVKCEVWEVDRYEVSKQCVVWAQARVLVHAHSHMAASSQGCCPPCALQQWCND
mmetsp:Transcript_9494/g.20233  ORF Transcript_9494/g.20233 Transcript_9494/m.20233 type:complete len:92 (+) Transcript_9494:374-649(+)